MPEPVTPLTATWLLPRLEETFAVAQYECSSVDAPRPLHVLVNGWYFCSPLGSGSAWKMLGMLRRPRLVLSILRMNSHPEIIHRDVIEPATVRWREELMPRYRLLVEHGTRDVERADDAALAKIVDDIADVAGEYLFSITLVGGHAWKMESVLADFYTHHLRPTLGGHHQALVMGLVEPKAPEQHAIRSFDWFRPTAGELGPPEAPPTRAFQRLVEERERTEECCREALTPKLRARFEVILKLAQLYARLREEQVGLWTLGWPLARRALHCLGESCVRRGVLDHAEDIHFLEREEIEGATSRVSSVAERRDRRRQPRRARLARRARVWHPRCRRARRCHGPRERWPTRDDRREHRAP